MPAVAETAVLHVYVWESEANRIQSVCGLWVVTLSSCRWLPAQCSYCPRQSSVPFPSCGYEGPPSTSPCRWCKSAVCHHVCIVIFLLSPSHGHLLVTQPCPQPNSFDMKMEAAWSLGSCYPATVWCHVTTKKTTVRTLTAVKTGKLDMYIQSCKYLVSCSIKSLQYFKLIWEISHTWKYS
jgi:hypothetical protein